MMTRSRVSLLKDETACLRLQSYNNRVKKTRNNPLFFHYSAFNRYKLLLGSVMSGCGGILRLYMRHTKNRGHPFGMSSILSR